MKYTIPYIGGPLDGQYYESDTLPPNIREVAESKANRAEEYLKQNKCISELVKVRRYCIRKYECPTGHMYYDNLTGKRKEYIVPFEVYVIMDDLNES